MGLVYGLDPKALDQAGWGLVLPADLDDATTKMILSGLSPLLKLRQDQARSVFRQFVGSNGVRPGEKAAQFLMRQGAGPGPVDPNRVPYYLLIAASPEQISPEFQLTLGVQHAVGRVWFDHPEGWSAYAESVVRSEVSPSYRPAGITFFAPQHPGDPYTANIQSLLASLVKDLQSILSGWQIDLPGVDQTHRHDLSELLEKAAPRLLFLAGHSVRDGLLCADWPGPQSVPAPVSPDMVFDASSVPPDVDFSGMMIIDFASYSLGRAPLASGSTEQAPSFSATLAQRLLSRPQGRGAQAVVGWVDRVWSFATAERIAREQVVFSSVFQRLAESYPLGAALEFISERYAELVTDLISEQEEIDYGKAPDEEKQADMWVALIITRGLAVFGDPAVRLPHVAEQKQTNAVDLMDQVFTRSGSRHVGERQIELEIALSRRGITEYQADLRLVDRQGGSDVQASGKLSIDFTRLEASLANPDDYGSRLGKVLFDDAELHSFFSGVLHQADAHRLPLNLHLSIAQTAMELHEVKWELIHEPQWEKPLLLNPQVHFTRYLHSADWQAVRLYPRKAFDVLSVALGDRASEGVVQSESDNLAAWMERMATIYQGLSLDTLTDRGGMPVDLDVMTKALSQGIDWLHLELPVRWNSRQSAHMIVWADANGQLAPAPVDQMVARLRELARAPRVIVLKSEYPGPLAAQLAEAGVPVVVILPENIRQETEAGFLASFVAALSEHGAVEPAAATARLAVSSQPDFWMPVVYTRLKNGRLWSEPAKKK